MQLGRPIVTPLAGTGTQPPRSRLRRTRHAAGPSMTRCPDQRPSSMRGTPRPTARPGARPATKAATTPPDGTRDGRDGRGWQAGPVGVPSLPPPRPWCVVRVPGAWCRGARAPGAAGESRSGRTGRPSCSRTARAAARRRTPSGADLVPAAGRNRGGSLAGRSGEPLGRWRRHAPPPRFLHRPTVVAGVPGGGDQGPPPPRRVQAGTASSVGSTPVHEEPSSAERITASSTNWTCKPSANEGAGSTPVAIASTKSRIWWVKECS